ncbi:uncharacterized protein LOC135605525 [Musa acuminata AAA Group]|uniref:uncharacterized protein LOC135605525 n=1 Tax=Musa acuminata AAA Group TaxID=214697 RepID=UPI0031CE8F78
MGVATSNQRRVGAVLMANKEDKHGVSSEACETIEVSPIPAVCAIALHASPRFVIPPTTAVTRWQVNPWQQHSAGASISARRAVSVKAELPKPKGTQGQLILLRFSGRRASSHGFALVTSLPSTPPNMSEKVAESIRNAEETCAKDAASGECAAAWDEVEELSAAASHARDKLKVGGPQYNGRRASYRRLAPVASSPPTPPNISEKVVESIKNAQETCAEDAASGECAAAWDEVEELSAAASHARDKLKADNPETDEGRTYE